MAGERKPVFGVGINDAPPGEYATNHYKTWQNMLKRCYCPQYQDKQPKYKDCFVCEEWLVYSNFRNWMNRQDWRGKELDKDILCPGNREYAPDKCMFVSRQINSLLHERDTGRELPQGVWFDKYLGKYKAEFIARGKKTYIGVYDDPEEGGRAYRKAKANHIRSMAGEQGGRLRSALMRHAQILERRGQ